MNIDQTERTKYIVKILFLILCLNWCVALMKIIYGLATHFTAMTADGLHSLSDGASNIIGIVGISLASRPADEDHPYGHKKYETLFSLCIAALLFFVAFNLFKEGITHIFKPRIPEINAISFVVMALTTCVNIFVMSYEYKKGKELKSDILVSDSLHTKADIFISISVIIALIVIKLGYPILDPIVTMLISIFIAYSGYEILKHSSNILCDSVANVDNKRIEDVVLSIDGVKACHKIRTRGREDDIYIDLHVQVKASMHVNKAHDISYKIEEALKKDISGVSDVVVHIEPDDHQE